MRIAEASRQRLRHLMGRRTPEGAAGIAIVGHREYVGGMWDEIGQLQFDFLIAQGLQPESVFLDIACGSLRGGVHFIRYLEAGNYLGIDKETALIERGLETELPADVREEKMPEFVVSGAFEFDRFSRRPDFSLAQSLFSHLVEADIELCLRNLRRSAAPHHRFFATFFAGDSEQNACHSHAHASFQHKPEKLIALGESNGWQCDYIGDWGHPRGQVMMQFVAPAQEP
jgi:SAM-dependent methyltransferase